MRTRSFAIVALALAVLLVGAGALYAYDHSQRNTIAKGVRVAGIDVGGLSPARARAKLRADYLAPLSRPVVLQYHRHRFKLDARRMHVAADVDGMVDEALARSRSGNFFSRVGRELSGGSVSADLQPRVAFDDHAVSAMVTRVRHTIDRSPRNAHVSFTAASLGTVPGQTGVTVQGRQLHDDIVSALNAASGARAVTIHTKKVQPTTTTQDLAARYPTVITIDRGAFQLHLWKHLKMVHSYTIAVGMQGLETPAGLYDIQEKEVDPSWHVPNSSWAGSLAGQTIPPGPQDPIKARWMGVAGGAGIHGTDESGSLGSAASHGCIRMAIPDVIALYPQVPLHTPVYIG